MLFIDTSVWSLAYRRDRPEARPEVGRLMAALLGEEDVATTGLVLQELLHGLHGPKRRASLPRRLWALPLLEPKLTDHVAAADLGNRCRRRGVQVQTVDSLIASLCISNDLELLTTDRDFEHIARHEPLRLWRAA